VRCGFRVDASIDMGSGHIMRCLTLADALRAQGTKCLFFCRPHTGNMLNLITSRGHKTINLPTLICSNSTLSPDNHTHENWLGTDWSTDAQDTRRAIGKDTLDWLVVDHYALDHRWERELRSCCKRLMVIDDIADRMHDCDLLLDQNLGRATEDYHGLLPAHTSTLIGQQYALLRPEFLQLRIESLSRRKHAQFKHLLISMGGVDIGNATGSVLETIQSCDLPIGLYITVVMGLNAPWLQQVQTQATQMKRPTKLLVGITDMERLLADSDLAIGAAGGSAWERCCLGLPSLLLVLADNQENGAKALHQAGAAISMQHVSEIKTFFENNAKFEDISTLLQQMSIAAARVTDGNGLSRITQKMIAQ
jgi:UDP-2,4-diacetamido-2,4,6-trideoxy-beta-L-altropyranose hydrolase